MIPLFLLTGFLGAGKTSVINSLLRSCPPESLSRTAVLVNDFGSCPVDAGLIQQTAGELDTSPIKIYEVSNGSIFCTCKSDSFVQGLKLLGRTRPERILVEASGMADPSGFDRLLHEYQIAHQFLVRSIYCVIDPVVFLKLHTRLESLPRQVCGADVLVINKTDCTDPDAIRTLNAVLDALNPRAIRIPTTFGHIPGGLNDQNLPEHTVQDGALVTCNTPENRPAALLLQLPAEDGKHSADQRSNPRSTTVSRESLGTFFRDHDIWRVKGWLPVDGQMHYVSDTGRGLTFTPGPVPQGISPGLTVILAPDHAQRLADGWRRLIGHGGHR